MASLNDSKTKNDMQDIKYVEEAEESVATETDADRVAEEKALVRKIDIALLPCIWIMYLLSYMDVRRPYRMLPICLHSSLRVRAYINRYHLVHRDLPRPSS